MELHDRTRRILTGLITICLVAAVVVYGVRRANGALRPRYRVTASFTAAGQGLQQGSDVKIHGVNVGRVKDVRLVDGRAFVAMDIDRDERIPVEAKAVIRPKTLFGEKFVDVDPGEGEEGPYLGDGGEITDTLGGFELERVLSDIYPVLQAIDPEELATVLDTLATGAEGQGPAINRQLANFAALARIQAEHAADTDQFLRDLAAISDVVSERAAGLGATARDLNEVLPTINANEDELSVLLREGARLAGDTADLLEANRPLLEKAVTEGGKVLAVAGPRAHRVGPLVTGLRQFFQTLAEAADGVDFGDGTKLARIKLVLGEDHACGDTGPFPVNCLPSSGLPASGGRPPVDLSRLPGFAIVPALVLGLVP